MVLSLSMRPFYVDAGKVHNRRHGYAYSPTVKVWYTKIIRWRSRWRRWWGMKQYVENLISQKELCPVIRFSMSTHRFYVGTWKVRHRCHGHASTLTAKVWYTVLGRGCKGWHRLWSIMQRVDNITCGKNWECHVFFIVDAPVLRRR